MKERDQQRRAQSDEFPSDEEHLDVAGQRNQQHACHKHREQDEVAVITGLAMQISIRKRRHNSRDTCRKRPERKREPIDKELDRDATVVRGRPGAVGDKLLARSFDTIHDECNGQRCAGGYHRDSCDSSCPSLRQRSIEKRCAAKHGKQHCRRSDSDEHEQRKRKARHHSGTMAAGGRNPRLP